MWVGWGWWIVGVVMLEVVVVVVGMISSPMLQHIIYMMQETLWSLYLDIPDYLPKMFQYQVPHNMQLMHASLDTLYSLFFIKPMNNQIMLCSHFSKGFGRYLTLGLTSPVCYLVRFYCQTPVLDQEFSARWKLGVDFVLSTSKQQPQEQEPSPKCIRRECTKCLKFGTWI